MDDLSQMAIKLVIEYCLEILEEAETKIDGKPTLRRLEKALNHLLISFLSDDRPAAYKKFA
jgi:hypothetical protein